MAPESRRADPVESQELLPQVRAIADRFSQDHEQRMEQAMEAYNKSIAEILDKGRAEIRRIVGAKTWAAVRHVMRREKRTLQERMQPPEGPFRNLVEELRTRKEAVAKFLDEEGVPRDRVTRIAQQHLGHIRDLPLTPATRPGQAYPLPGHEDKLRDLLGGPLGMNPRRWFVFRPPFAGGYGPAYYTTRSPRAYRVGVYPEGSLHVDTGRIRHTMWLSIVDASDLDLAHGIIESAVECVFTAPVSGNVEVVVEATCGAALHELAVTDEFGFSSSTTEQNHYLTLQVLHPNISNLHLNKVSALPCTTDETLIQTREFLIRGHDYFVTGRSDGAVSANDTMVIRVGARTDDATMTNDMEIDSKSTFEWTIKRISVRVAP